MFYKYIIKKVILKIKINMIINEIHCLIKKGITWVRLILRTVSAEDKRQLLEKEEFRELLNTHKYKIKYKSSTR